MPSKLPDENDIPFDSIDSNYRKGLFFYDRFMSLVSDKGCQEVNYNGELYDRDFMLKMYEQGAINKLKKALEDTAGQTEQGPRKLEILLLLVKLYPEEQRKTERERCFDMAVETAIKLWGSDFQNTPAGQEVFKIYITDINTAFLQDIQQENTPALIRSVQRNLLTESALRQERRGTEKLGMLEHVGDYIRGHAPIENVLQKLENIFGPLELVALPKRSEKPLPGITSEETISQRRNPSLPPDFGLQDIVKPFFNNLIKVNENETFSRIREVIDQIESIETSMPHNQNKHDYSHFVRSIVSRCMHPMKFRQFHEREKYTQHILKALDISEQLMLSHPKESERLSQDIDAILGGKIERRTLHMVKSMLLSRNEIMDGLGYPFGLNREHIPLEGKIYQIIRAHQALSHEHPREDIPVRLKEWIDLGYADGDIFQIFTENFQSGKIPVLLGAPRASAGVSEHRKKIYLPFIQKWYEIRDTIQEIEDTHSIGRHSLTDTRKQNVAFKKANELRTKLLRIADIRKYFIVTRHGETISDTPGGPPGDSGEVLTEKGIQSSIHKGKMLKGLSFQIFSSPLVRAQQTSALICGQVKRCINYIVPQETAEPDDFMICPSYPSILVENSLRNPPKNRDNNRDDSLLAKFLADINVRELWQFLRKFISSGEESVNLIVTHRDTARHFITILENLYRQDSISATKTKIENDTVYEFFFRGDRVIGPSESRKYGLVFSIDNWKKVIDGINSITEDVYGEKFYDLRNEEVALIEMHDCFLDYVDRVAEKFPEKKTEFLSRIREDSITAHCYPILEKECILEGS